MLVLSANLKKNILADHRKEADNNLNALNAIVAAEILANPTLYPSSASPEAELMV